MASIERRKFRAQISYQVRIRRAGIRSITKSFLTRTEAKKWARSMEKAYLADNKYLQVI